MTRRGPAGLLTAAAAALLLASGCASPTDELPLLPAPSTSRATKAPAPSAEPTASASEEPAGSPIARALANRIYFGHQSVGFNIMKGINQLSRGEGLGTPAYVDLTKGEPVPTDGGRFIAHVKIGTNGKPLTKIAAFDKALRGGLAGQVDVAVFKLCYVDIDARTNVGTIFKKYRTAMAALERDFPQVTFLHATVPLETRSVAANINRTRLNELIRKEYGPTGRLWDIARVEATDPDGKPVGGTRGGKKYEALFGDYASDGAHLNETGGKLVAESLLTLVAEVA